MVAWGGIEPPTRGFSISKAGWKAYEEAFAASPHNPRVWTLCPEFREPAKALEEHRAATKKAHLTTLLAEIAAGRIAAHHPQRRTCVRPGDARIDSTYLVRLDGIARLCGVLGIDAVKPAERGRMPCIRDEARPAAMPSELDELNAADLVLREPSFGPDRGQVVCTVGDFRSDVDRRMQRQHKGEFTFDEAVQILADAHPELDVERFATRLRDALREGDELDALDGIDSFPLARGEAFLADLDRLNAAKLDAWLLNKVGYGFPMREEQTLPPSTGQVATAQKSTPDRGRLLKRGALISDNKRRWPTIERNLKDGATNELSKAARDTKVGWWWEGSALEWARARGKVQEVNPVLAGATSIFHLAKG